MINGRCYYGRIRYEVDDDITDFSPGHCSQCRRLHGAAYATFAGVIRDKFRYVSGEADSKAYAWSKTSDRVFCTECGSKVDFKPEPESLCVCMDTVDGNPSCAPGYHQYVGSKVAWHEIADDLKQYDSWPPD